MNKVVFRSRRWALAAWVALAVGVTMQLLFRTEPSTFEWVVMVGGLALVAWAGIQLIRDRKRPTT